MCFSVSSPNTRYTEEYIYSRYNYLRTQVKRSSTGDLTATPISKEYVFRTDRKVPKLGVMLVGLGGNNGSTVLGGVLANRHNITWKTKNGVHKPDFLGSLTQASTTRLGNTAEGEEIYVPFKDVLPMAKPTDIEIGGWDMSNTNMKQAMERAEVLDFDLQRQLGPYMEKITPLPSIYYPSFIASNQEDRADHLIDTREYASLEHLDQLRQDIREFKKNKGLDKVIVLWTANTERYCKVIPGVHDTEENLMRAIDEGHPEIAPSQMFAMAALLEGCSYINGSPQNTLVNAIIETAERTGLFVGGDDFKSGQTKFKSVLVDFLVSAGIKPESIVSYNHLGNNDGKNLNAPQTFRSKELSKSNVVDDMVASNQILYPIDKKTGKQTHPDHTVVIKYVPYVKDSKRAMDEYTSSIFLGGKNTLVVHNTCEDSLLAAPIILDLILLTELFERIHVAELPQKIEMMNGFSDSLQFNRLDSVLSVLSYLLKAPRVPKGTPVINALSRQRSCLENIMRACLGLPAENGMLLEHKLPNQIVEKIDREREVREEGIIQGSRCCAPLSPN